MSQLSQRVSEGWWEVDVHFQIMARNVIIESWEGLSWKGSERSFSTNPRAMGRDISR